MPRRTTVPVGSHDGALRRTTSILRNRSAHDGDFHGNADTFAEARAPGDEQPTASLARVTVARRKRRQYRSDMAAIVARAAVAHFGLGVDRNESVVPVRQRDEAGDLDCKTVSVIQ